MRALYAQTQEAQRRYRNQGGGCGVEGDDDQGLGDIGDNVTKDEARLAQDFANRLYELGVYVSGFFYPVVPMGKARIRVQMSAALSSEQLEHAIVAFTRAGHELGVIA